MTKQETNKVQTVNPLNQTVEVSTNQQQQTVAKEIVILTGITTSQIRRREKLSDTPAYCFLKAECKNCSQLAHVDLECKECNADKEDIPVIFRIKENGN